MGKFYRDLAIIFLICFAYLMSAGGTSIMAGVIASLAAGGFFALLTSMCRATFKIIIESRQESKSQKHES